LVKSHRTTESQVKALALVLRGALASGPARFSIIPHPSGFVNRQIVQKFQIKISQNWAKIFLCNLHKYFFQQIAQIFFSANCTKIWDKNILKLGKNFFKNN